MAAGYYSNPTVHADTVVFVCEDDLWSVPASGGSALRLTANPGKVATPALSPDGAQLAFAGFDEGSSEVYVMPTAGGAARRLTFLGAKTHVVGWSPAGEIVFASNAAQAFGRDVRLYTLPPEGGEPVPLPYGPAMSLSYGPARQLALGRNTTDLARWKRYRGGTAGEIWLRGEDGQWRQFVHPGGNVALPLWLAGRVYFISDHEGVGNLYSALPDGADLRRHTDHHDFYVRFPATDGSRLVYQAGADLYLYDPEAEGSTLIEVTLPSPKAQLKRRFVDAAKYLGDVSLSPSGEALALTSRAQAFSLPTWAGAVTRYGATTGETASTTTGETGETSAARYRLPVWLEHGPAAGQPNLAMIRDQDGDVILELHTAGPDADPLAEPERLSGLELGRALEVVASPRRAQLALTNHRFDLLLVDLDTRSVRQLARSRHAPIQGVSWSPDGRYLAYGFPGSANTCGLQLCDVTSGETWPLTEPVLWDSQPRFDPAGRYLYFLSRRTFDPVYDNLHFDLGFPKGGKPYLLTLQAELPSPFSAAGQAQQDAADKQKRQRLEARAALEPAPKPAEVRIDLVGVHDRIVALPVPEGKYEHLEALPDKLLYLSYPVEGALQNELFGAGEPSAKAALECYDFAARKLETLFEGVTDYTVSGDCTTLCLRVGNRLRVLAAGEAPPETDEPEDDKPGRESGWLDLERVRVGISPAAEWRQMFRDAWRLQLEHFWTEDMSGTDWQAVYSRYAPLLARVASRSELSDLLWEMQGELGTSHAYELGGDYREGPQYPQGFLGADLAYRPEQDAFEITQLVRGDPWDEESSSPLVRAGVSVRVGDRIVAVNGQRVGRERSPGSLLVHQAGGEVALTLEAARAGTTARGARRTVTVRALKDERPARYRDWVEANRRFVHERSGGQIGYVHIPDMGAAGYAEFHRGFLREAGRTGLIVDVRFNGGGHVSPLILEKLARRRLGYDIPRWGEPEPFPQLSLAGPLVALTNEHAGSDGDIFCHTFKLLGLGPLLGKRTWGGVVGITVNDLLGDGTVTTQPEFSFWFEDVGFGVENYGTDPTLYVDNTPQDYQDGRDAQLELALETALEGLHTRAFTLPDFSDRPRLGLPAVRDE